MFLYSLDCFVFVSANVHDLLASIINGILSALSFTYMMHDCHFTHTEVHVKSSASWEVIHH